METFVVNPKCVKLGELYGETDPNTFEWTDGLIASATRKFARDTSTVPTSTPIEQVAAAEAAVSDTSLSGKVNYDIHCAICATD